MHNNLIYAWSNSHGASQILMFYCNSLHHLASVQLQHTGQLLTHRFSLICLVSVSHWIEGVLPVWTSEPMSLLYCQNLNLKSAKENFLTSAVPRSTGANVGWRFLSVQSIVRCLFYTELLLYSNASRQKKLLKKKNKIHSGTSVSPLPARSVLMHIL